MSVAREALAIVFREHAGRLKSFKDDQRKIMKRTEEIFDECEVVVMEHMAEARWEEIVNIREITRQRLKKLTTVEDTYMSTWFKHQRTYRKRQSDDRRNETRQMKRRTLKTQPGRVQQVIDMFIKAFRSRPTDRQMWQMHRDIRRLLPDVPWVFETPDVGIKHWLEATICRLNRLRDNAHDQ
jgi:hypothetical protein